MATKQSRQHVIIVSGMSGAGKSTALNALEDMGYHCIDNLPASLIPALAKHLQAEPERYTKVALGMDARAPGLKIDNSRQWLDTLKSAGLQSQLLFLNAQDDVLVKRFSQTRRRHPLSPGEGSLQASIEKEREILEPLRTIADWEVDTTNTNIHQLTHETWKHVGPDTEQMTIVVQSFAFTNGVPVDSDFMFDLRCLPNPHWTPELRPLTGRDPQVAAWLEQQSEVTEMADDILQLLQRWLPSFESAHRSFVTVAVGCTGGKHRSVFTAERLTRSLREQFPVVMVHHRELGQ